MLSIPSVLLVLTATLFIGCYAPAFEVQHPHPHGNHPNPRIDMAKEIKEGHFMLKALVETVEARVKAKERKADQAVQDDEADTEIESITKVMKEVERIVCTENHPGSECQVILRNKAETNANQDEFKAGVLEAIKESLKDAPAKLQLAEYILNKYNLRELLDDFKSVAWNVHGKLAHGAKEVEHEEEKMLDDPNHKDHGHMSELNHMINDWPDHEKEWVKAVRGVAQLGEGLLKNIAHISKHRSHKHPGNGAAAPGFGEPQDNPLFPRLSNGPMLPPEVADNTWTGQGRPE